MMTSPMPFADFEIAYEELARAIDRAGPEGEALFLTKLVLTLASKIDRLDIFLEAMRIAEERTDASA